MTTVFGTLALLTLSAILVAFVFNAKNLGMSGSMQAQEDDEQMRAVCTTSGSESDGVATLH